jgi:kynurenine formamidase
MTTQSAINPNAAPYDGLGSKSPQWWPSRYGAGDMQGALNEITPERTIAALKIPTTGTIIELAPVLERDMPGPINRDWRQIILAESAMPGHNDAPSEFTGFEEFVLSGLHVGCHVDGLAHVGIAGRGYNGIHWSEFLQREGLKKLGAENMRPWVTRGLCLDVTAIHGVDMLDEGYVITVADLEAACQRQDVEIGAGDAVLLHTGWMSLWQKDNDRFLAGEPGIGWDAAHWLTDRRVSVIGADNWALEVLPFETPEQAFVVHQHLLAETGTYILENPKTADLVAGGHSEFLFIMTPIKGTGSTASMVSPIAIV